jgi:hypothetical protein
MPESGHDVFSQADATFRAVLADLPPTSPYSPLHRYAGVRIGEAEAAGLWNWLLAKAHQLADEYRRRLDASYLARELRDPASEWRMRTFFEARAGSARPYLDALISEHNRDVEARPGAQSLGPQQAPASAGPPGTRAEGPCCEGPIPPDRFRWRGKVIEGLSPLQWRLLEVLFEQGRPRGGVPLESVISHVYGVRRTDQAAVEKKRRSLKSLRERLQPMLDAADLQLLLEQANHHLRVTDTDPSS